MRDDEDKSRGRAKKLRKQMPKAEVILWKKLRELNRHGDNFRHQHPVGPYIADFACLDAMLIVELDGTTHDMPDAAAYDARRTAFLTSRGYRVLRFRNEEIYADLYRVIDMIMRDLPPPTRAAKAARATSPASGGG